MTAAKWTSNNTGAHQDLRYSVARFHEKGCLHVWAGWRCSDIINSDTCYENLIDGSHWDENGLNENLKGYENLKKNEKKSVSIKYENLKGYKKISVDF